MTLASDAGHSGLTRVGSDFSLTKGSVMPRPELEARVKQILTNRLGIPPDEIRLDARLADDLGMDSLDAIELAIATERQFGIAVSDEQVAKLRTVADIVALVQRLVDGEGAGLLSASGRAR